MNVQKYTAHNVKAKHEQGSTYQILIFFIDKNYVSMYLLQLIFQYIYQHVLIEV
jgi:hypothetical protein